MVALVVIIGGLLVNQIGAITAGKPSGVTMILLERDACFGKCPEYSLRITVDGAVQFEGKHWVKELGRRNGNVSEQDFHRLVQALDAADFDGLPDEFACGELATDAPSMWVTVMKDSRLKRVRYYFGCTGGPSVHEIARLVELGEKIDEVVGISRWVGLKGERRAGAYDPN